MTWLFWFKKILSFHLHPLALVLDLLVIGLILKALFGRQPKSGKTGRVRGWWKRRFSGLGTFCLVGGTLVLYLSSIASVSNPLVDFLERQYPPLDLEALPAGTHLDPEFVVVLSGGERFHPEKPASSLVSPEAYIRLMEGVRLMNRFPRADLVLTGRPMEVHAMHQAALSLGIEDRRIVKETESRDTKDHALYLREQLDGRQFALVTSGTHMLRAMGLFEGQGLRPVAAPCNLWVWPGWDRGKFFEWKSYQPSLSNLGKTNMAVHEYLGFAWARLLRQAGADE